MKPSSSVGVISFSIALLVALAGCGAGAGPESVDPNAPVTHEVTAELLERGQTVYTQNCAPCHGPKGKGDGPAAATLNPKPRDHSNGQYMDQLSDQKIADTVRMGGVISGYPNMPSSPHIQGEDMAALVAFVRSLSHEPSQIASVELKP